jgi:hypothetical protein
MNQSTIYRRHEARLAKTYALKDDPRPAIIRVMSGLPGLRMIIPPYEPTTPQTTTTNVEQRQENLSSNLLSSQRHHHHHHHHIGDYSEETFFRATDDDEQTSNNNAIDMSNNPSSCLSALQATLSTGVCCGVGEYVFGGHYGRRRRQQQQQLSSSNSPFHNNPQKHGSSSIYSPFIHGEGTATSDALNVYLMKSHHNNANVSPSSSSLTSVIRKPSSIILMAACNASILFGSKILLERTLMSSPTSIATTSSSNNGYNVISSTIAGGIVGVINSLMLYGQQKNALKMMFENPQHSTSSSSMLMTNSGMFHNPFTPFNYNLIGRYMVGATLYFGTYDCITSWMKTAARKQQNNTEDVHSRSGEKEGQSSNTMSIVLGGGLAGLVYTSVICRPQHHGMLRALSSTAIRAIPIHAFIFYGYETMKDGVRITQ